MKRQALLNTPARLLIAVGVLILAGEFLIMLLIEGVHTTFLKDVVVEKLVFEFLDPILLTLLVSPVLYLLIFRPMRAQQSRLEQQLDELRRFQRISIGRELRMKELEEEITALHNPLAVEPGGDNPCSSASVETPRRATEQRGTAQSLEESQRSALLFMLDDLEDARKKIEHSHQEWIAALDVVNDPIFLHDKQLRILRCNKAYQQCAGIPFHEIIGRLYYEVFPKIGAPLASCLRVMEKTEAATGEEEVVVGETTYRSRTFSVYGEQEAYLYSVHILEDITESRQAAEALSESETRFRNLVETTSDWIWEVDENIVYTYASPKIQSILGYEAAEIIGKTPFDLMPPDEAKRVAELFGPIAAAKKSFSNLENINLHTDGHRVVIETNGVPVFDAEGKFRGYRGMDRDITERKQAEVKLAEKEEKFRKITESTQDAIIMMGADQCISFWNAAAERIFGYTAAEAMGQELHALIVPASARVLFTQAFPHFQASGDGPLIGKMTEVSALRKGGEAFTVELSISATQLNGQWHAISTVRDITARKLAEAEIQHANRALATLSVVNRNLVHATDENELLQVVCQAIVQQRGYPLAWVGYVQHNENNSIKIMARADHDKYYPDVAQLTWAEGELGIRPNGTDIRSGITQISQDIANDPHYLQWRESMLKHGYASSIALPLLNRDKVVFGVLTVYAEEVNAFTLSEIELLEQMAGDLAFGVRTLYTSHERDLALAQNQRQLTQLQDSLEGTVRAIARIGEMRDPYTAGHQIRVADLAVAIAKQMGLPDEQVHAIHLAGTVHDLGKIQIPAEILSKPGKITDIEFSFIKIHAQAGYEILKGIDFPWPIAQMVLQHHERLDGSGYPQGLKGDAILLEAHILSVADVVEAMSSHRPYRAGLGIETALAEITRQRGIYYDPVVVDACLALFREQHYSLLALEK